MINREKIEIRISDNVEDNVSLDAMPLDAANSFLIFSQSLKKIASSFSPDARISFRNGSACVAIDAPPQDILLISEEIKSVVKGEARDPSLVKAVREIQTVIKMDNYSYNFWCNDRDIGTSLKEKPSVRVKSIRKQKKLRLKLLTGQLQGVGGVVPNYHLSTSYSNTQERETISCTELEAIEIKDYLYKELGCITIERKTQSNSTEEKVELIHLGIIPLQDKKPFRSFIKHYYHSKDIIDKLDQFYNLLEESSNPIKVLTSLINASKYIFRDVNELKTLLILSEGFKSNVKIKEPREELLIRFNEALKV